MTRFETKEAMQPIVEKWIALMEKDAEVAKKCQGINCSMQFEINDLDFTFYTNFMDGKVNGGIGKDDPEAMVLLEMSSETFDGLMSGEVDGASAAMSGELTFSGDMSAAMGLQALQDDLTRMYIEVKA